MISVSQALDALIENAPVAGEDSLPLSACLGRRLAADVVARTTLPPSDVSAMDGYAVRLEDTHNIGDVLRVIGEAPAGTPSDLKLGTGEAIRIFTGGALPDGADHVLIQEDTTRDGETISVTDAQTVHRHIRKAGLDFSTGDTLIKAGTWLGPAEISLAAAGNHSELVVARKLKVAILASGNELKPPGSELERGQIVNSNTSAISSLVTAWGGEPIELGIARDSVDDIVAMARSVDHADILVPVGGASVGDHDHMRAAFKALGFGMIFEKIAVKPGKPTWFARSGEQCVLGLPGNPASAYVCAHLFLAPLLNAGVSQKGSRSVMLTHELSANGRRETYLRARYVDEDRQCVEVLSQQDSSLIRPFTVADCLIRREANAERVAEGEKVDVFALTGSSAWG